MSWGRVNHKGRCRSCQQKLVKLREPSREIKNIVKANKKKKLIQKNKQSQEFMAKNESMPHPSNPRRQILIIVQVLTLQRTQKSTLKIRQKDRFHWQMLAKQIPLNFQDLIPRPNDLWPKILSKVAKRRSKIIQFLRKLKKARITKQR